MIGNTYPKGVGEGRAVASGAAGTSFKTSRFGTEG
jgi:hypothetical protein